TSGNLRAVLAPFHLVERQRIHIGAKQERGTGLGAIDVRDDARATHAGARLEADGPQPRRYELCRSMLGERELGLAVQRPPGLDQLRLECGALAVQLLRHAPEDI